MAFYTIAKYLNEFGIKAENLPKELFDYIFLGIGNVEEVATKSGLSKKLIEEMRREFLYWYPVDMRISAKELLPNHLTFFIFHHVAIFPPELWPRGVSVNGMLMVEGEKMSKSKGNFITLMKAIETYGADPTRCALLLAAEGMDDPDWRAKNVEDVRRNLEAFYNLAVKIIGIDGGSKGHMEEWLISAIQRRIKQVSDAMEELKTRTAIEIAFYEVWKDIRWYLRRRIKPHAETLKKALSIWVRLMAPFTPHICEEIWSLMGEKTFVSIAKWPEYKKELINSKAEETENLIMRVLEDTQNIIRVTGIKPKTIYYYVAAPWKWTVFTEALHLSLEGELSMKNLMPKLMEKEELKPIASKIVKYAKETIEDINYMPKERQENLLKAGVINEEEILNNEKEFLSLELKAEIKVFREDAPEKYDPMGKSEQAKPFRPAIYIE